MLTAAQIRAAEPRDRAYKMADGLGLFLLVAPTGLKSWRMAFRFAKKEQLLVFGRFPDMSLAEARIQRDQARVQIARQRQPGRRAQARPRRDRRGRRRSDVRTGGAQLGTLQRPTWSAEHYKDVIFSLERHVFPAIGALALTEISKHQVLELIRVIEASGAIETARRVRTRISAVFEANLADNNPAATIRKAMAPKEDGDHQLAVLTIEDARAALSALESAATRPIDALAARFQALTAVRPGVIPGTVWEEFEGVDWDEVGRIPTLGAIWRIPARRMKLTVSRKKKAVYDHVVPLSAAAVDVLRKVRALGVDPTLVFARGRASPIGVNALLNLHAAAGLAGRHTPHGWRATFSTILNLRRRQDRDEINRALAHLPDDFDEVEAAYNRAEFLELRRDIFDDWAALLCGAGDKAVPLPEAA
jgi:integrase